MRNIKTLEEAVRYYRDMSNMFCDSAKAGMRLMILEIYGITHSELNDALNCIK